MSEPFDAAQFLQLKGLVAPGTSLFAEALTGGYWNQVARVRGRGLDLVVKRYHAGRGPLLFPNLPDAEAAALKRLSPSGHVPAFRAYFPNEADHHPVLIYDFQLGRIYERDCEGVGRALKAIHAIKLEGDNHPFRRLSYRAQSILGAVERIFAETPGSIDSPRAKALLAKRPPLRDLPLPPALSIIHTDCGPGNLIETPDGRVVVIDWQCCGAGDPAEDLYAFLSPAFQILSERPPLHSGEIARLWVAYGDPDAEARLQVLWHYYSFRMLAYCAQRHIQLAGSEPVASERYARAFDREFAEVFP